MARPRTFDPDAVLDAAQRAFHAAGYGATSIQDLVQATGLSRSSLYGTWGDKHGLYLAVLDRYAEAGRRQTAATCDGVPPLDAVRAMLEAWAGSRDGRGCLLVNAAAERSGQDPATVERADRARVATLERLAGLVRQAQGRGEIDAGRPADDLARFVTGVLYGLRGLETAGATGPEMRAVVEETMGALTR